MASSIIGALRVNLGLDSAELSNGLKAARGQLSQFAGQLGKVAAGLVAAAVPAMTAMGVSAVNAAEEIRKLSALANATPEEFQRTAAAAAKVGVEQVKLADILKDTNDRVGEFIQTGGGEMKDFFEKIAPKVGVTAKQFEGLSGPAALQLYVQTLQKAGVNQQELTYYMESLADEATALAPLFANGAQLLDQYAGRAVALGAVMDNKTVAAFARVRQSLSDVGMVFTGIRNMVAQQVAPVMGVLAEAFVKAAEAGQPLGDAIRAIVGLIPRLASYATAVAAVFGAQWVAGFAAARLATFSLVGALSLLRGALLRSGIGIVVVAVGELIYQMSKLVGKLGGVGETFTLLKNVAVEVWRRIGLAGQGLYNIMRGVSQGIAGVFLLAISQIAKAWDALVNGMSSAWNMIADSAFGEKLGLAKAFGSSISQELGSASDALIAAAVKNIRGGGAQLKEAITSPLESLDELRSRASAADSEVATLGDTATSTGAALGGAADAGAGKLSNLQQVVKDLAAELTRLKATWGMSETETAVWDKLTEAGVSAASATGQQIAATVRQIEGLKQLKSATDEWKSSISGAFASFLSGAATFKQALGQILGKLGEIWMNSAFENLFSGSSGLLGSVLSWLGIGKNANGTPSWRGGLTQINERGGEIVDLPKGTRIIPHDVSTRMMEQSSQTVDVRVGVDNDGNLQAYVAQTSAAISARVVQANNLQQSQRQRRK